MKRRGNLMMGGLVGALLVGILPVPALAQQPAPAAQAVGGVTAENTDELVELTRAAIQMERQAIVTKAMDLTPEEMQAFWPVYRDYRLEMVKVGDQILALIEDFAFSYDGLSDSAANALLTDFVAIEKQRAALKEQYLPRFKQALSAKKVVRFYQIENKLDILLLKQAADVVPLAR